MSANENGCLRHVESCDTSLALLVDSHDCLILQTSNAMHTSYFILHTAYVPADMVQAEAEPTERATTAKERFMVRYFVVTL